MKLHTTKKNVRNLCGNRVSVIDYCKACNLLRDIEPFAAYNAGIYGRIRWDAQVNALVAYWNAWLYVFDVF